MNLTGMFSRPPSDIFSDHRGPVNNLSRLLIITTSSALVRFSLAKLASLHVAEWINYKANIVS
jgi:hypothetical protein